MHIVDGIDGNQQKELFKQARLISNNVLNEWSPGAIGSALSHMHSWRLCMQLGKPIIVVEDDTILAKELDKNLQTLLEKEKSLPPFLLLGWNLDSLLQAEFEPGMELISLFEPAYPDEFAITRLVNCKTERKMGKLKTLLWTSRISHYTQYGRAFAQATKSTSQRRNKDGKRDPNSLQRDSRRST